MPESEGRLGIALNAVAVDDPDADMSQRRSHVRLLTLSPHGYIVQDEAYIDGIEARGAQFSRGANGERVIVGTIVSDARTLSPSAQLRAAIEGPQAEENPENEEKPPATEQAGWVFVAMPLDPYDDPCLPKTRAQETRSRARLND